MNQIPYIWKKFMDTFEGRAFMAMQKVERLRYDPRSQFRVEIPSELFIFLGRNPSI
jgi:hypothetical protein